MEPRRTDSERGNHSAELGLIRRIRTRAAIPVGSALRLGIGDDCALLRPRPGEEFAVTTDLSIAGRHFRLDWHSPESIGHRALARGLSDLAAMGARPVAAFLSLGLPRDLAIFSGGSKTGDKGLKLQYWIDAFLDGLLTLARAHQTPLAGGDLAESPVALADIVLIGAVPRGKALLRSGARPGHLLYVTGALGGASAGLARLTQLATTNSPGPRPPRIPKNLAPLLAPHLFPQPRIAQGLYLQRRSLTSAAIDISDGLSTDLAHLCEESNVAAEVDAARLPIHSGATLQQALHGGEDYELLFTAPAETRIARKIAGISITKIGRIVRARRNHPAVTLITPQGREPLEPQGWEHFS
ncbi:MAG: thiamine-phosphate kinase [Terracidiphilus sp.]|jgi:thiamine-monophosphate kinase